MRILVATAVWFPDAIGGVARVATETARHLARRGHDVTVLAPRDIVQNGAINGLRVCPILPQTMLPNTATDIPATALAARRLGGPWDVVLAHQPTTGAGIALARLNAPLAVAYHASTPREIRYLRDRLPAGLERSSTHLIEPILVASERVALRNATRILVLSDFTRSLLAEDHPSSLPRVVNVWGGVDTDDFSPGDGHDAARAGLGVGPDEQLLLTVRRLDSRMGLEGLLRAVGLLPDSVTLAVAGDGALRSRLESLAHELGISEHVRFLGAVPDGELRDWYRAADAFVLPTVAYEGFGIATAEALASGTPVVGTPVGATPELLTPLEPAMVSAGTTPEQLRAAIGRVLAMTGPELRERCRRYAVENLAWSSTVVRWETALAEAAAG
jgi:glycosyltransferase involved in cell wall biosynthesis